MTDQYSDIGQKNLDTLEEAKHFTEWMYEQVRPYLHGTIFEIGSGSGTYSQKVIRDFPKNQILLSDIDTAYVAGLTKKYGNEKVSAHTLDLGSEADFTALGTTYDSAFALNVLEHVEDDVRALINVREHLSTGGTFVVLVPAHPFLYNCIDKAIGHWRRYTKRELVEKARQAGFTVQEVSYFNALSIPGWYINGNILKNPVVSGGLVKLYDRIIPIVRFCERYILRRRIGISLIAILTR